MRIINRFATGNEILFETFDEYLKDTNLKDRPIYLTFDVDGFIDDLPTATLMPYQPNRNTGAVTIKQTPQYTGTKILGIGTMHKIKRCSCVQRRRGTRY